MLKNCLGFCTAYAHLHRWGPFHKPDLVLTQNLSILKMRETEFSVSKNEVTQTREGGETRGCFRDVIVVSTCLGIFLSGWPPASEMHVQPDSG